MEGSGGRAAGVRQFRNDGIPPIRLAKDTRILSDCSFIEHRRPGDARYLREQDYDEDVISRLSRDDGDTDNSTTPVTRHNYDGSQSNAEDERRLATARWNCPNHACWSISTATASPSTGGG